MAAIRRRSVLGVVALLQTHAVVVRGADLEILERCPPKYDPARSYSGGRTVSLDNSVYQCRRGDASQYCDLYPPDYVHEAAGGAVVHAIGEELGWRRVACCETARCEGNNDTEAEASPKPKKLQLRRGRRDRPRPRTKRANANSQVGKVKSDGGVVWGPSHSAYVDRRDPNENYYRSPTLRFDHDDVATLIQFELTLPDANARDIVDRDFYATLQVYHLKNCKDVEAQVVSGDFYERDVTWRNAPSHPGPQSSHPALISEGRRGATQLARKDSWQEFDVSAALLWSVEVKRQEFVTFRIHSSRRGGGDCALAGEEYADGEFAPRLRVRFDVPRKGARPTRRKRKQGFRKRVKRAGGGGGGGVASSSAYRASDAREYAYDPYVKTDPEEWYVDYSLGSEGGQCVKNCEFPSGPSSMWEEGEEFCGGPARTWDIIYDSPRECCAERLWWMGRGRCVPDYEW